MAERRMFAKTIIDSDAFLDMPQSSQLLYFHLSMRADDDGFINNPKSIMRNVKCNDDDLKLLGMKKFIIPFESGVVVIKHWKIHNYIRSDRYKETKYKRELSSLNIDENNAYTQLEKLSSGIPSDYQVATDGIPMVVEMDTQVRLGKVRLGKDNKSLCSKFKYSNEHMELAETLLSLIKTNNPNYKLTGSLDRWANEFRLMVERDNRTVEQIQTVMEWSQQDSFWQSNILSAGKLREKFDQLSLRMNQKQLQQRQPTQREINAEERRRIAEEYDRINSNQTY